MTWHDIDNSALGLQLLLSFSGPDSGITEQGFSLPPNQVSATMQQKEIGLVMHDLGYSKIKRAPAVHHTITCLASMYPLHQ